MIAAASLVDSRGAPEFSPGDHADILVQAPVVQVLDQRGHSLVELGQLDGQSREVGTMSVPTAKGQRDTPDTGFDQPPGHQELVHPVWSGVFSKGRCRAAPAVTVSQGLVFLIEVHRLDQPAGAQHVEGLAGERVGRLVDGTAIDVATETVDAREETTAVAEPIERDAIEFHVGHGFAGGLEGRIALPQESGQSRVRVRRVAGGSGQSDKRWYRRIDGPLEPGHGGSQRGVPVLPTTRATRVTRE